jgi:hypothetical protein
MKSLKERLKKKHILCFGLRGGIPISFQKCMNNLQLKNNSTFRFNKKLYTSSLKQNFSVNIIFIFGENFLNCSTVYIVQGPEISY